MQNSSKCCAVFTLLAFIFAAVITGCMGRTSHVIFKNDGTAATLRAPANLIVKTTGKTTFRHKLQDVPIGAIFKEKLEEKIDEIVFFFDKEQLLAPVYCRY